MNNRKRVKSKGLVSCFLPSSIHCFELQFVAGVHVYGILLTGGWSGLRSYCQTVPFIIEIEHKEVQVLTFHVGNIMRMRFRLKFSKGSSTYIF